MRIRFSLAANACALFARAIGNKNKPARLLIFVVLLLGSTAALAAITSRDGSWQRSVFGSSDHIIQSAPSSSKAAVNPLPVTVAPQTAATMDVARRNHSATLLADGRVLICGGENAGGVLNGCEIYDPVSGSFSVTGSLNGARADHAAVLLADGRVLLTGGRSAVGAVNTTELFDPATGTLSAGANMSVARAGHSATLLADGRVLIAGGDEDGSAEIFDPSSGAFSAAGANLSSARSKHSAALLADGRVLLVGGNDTAGNALSSGEIFDPATASFTGVGGMEVARMRPLLRVLFDGKVQIIGGIDDRSMEIYDPAAGIFGGYAQVPPDGDLHVALIDEIMAAPTRSALLTGGQTVTELGNSALAAGGDDANGNATNAATFYASSGASVSSDKIDYLPGTQVIITGRGFQPNENVTLTFHEYPHVDTAELHTFTVQADADGNFTFDQYSPEAADVGITYILGAKGEASGKTAQTTFHDSVAVTPGSGGTNISADKAANASSPAFTTLGNIKITEGTSGDFATGTGKTLILTAPSGWQFNAGVGSASGAKESGSGGPAISNESISVTSTTITVTYDVSSHTNLNSLTISGIQVRATDGANVPGSGNILRTAGNPGTATITGVSNGTTNFGSLSQVAGAVNKLVVTLPGQTFTDGTTVAGSGNSGTPTNQTAGTPFNISALRATDQFFNVVTTYSGAKTISYTGPGSNAGFAAPSYTTAVTFTSGVSTTTLATTLRKAETTTITASDGTTTGPASSNLTVAPGALASFKVTNTSDGNIGTQTAGTPFDIKVRAIDSSGNTDTTFNANGFKVNITPSSGTLSAGGGTSSAFVNGVLSPWSVTFSTTGTYPGSFSLTATGIGGASGISGTSNSFTVNGPPCTNPSVTTQPTNQTVTYGAASVSFTAAASGTPTPTIQWQVSTGGPFTNLSNTAPYSGVTTGTLLISNPTVSLSGSQYRAVFTNTCGGPQTATSNAATLAVNQKSITPSVTANNKTYDGNNTATIATCSLAGVEAADVGNVTCSAAGPNTFADASVGNGKTVSATNISLGGSAAGNYVLSSTSATTTANITTKAITVTLTANDKVYDGNTTELDANMSCSVSGVLPADSLNVICTASSGTFNTKDVTTANTVTATVTISGSAAGNYTLGAAGTTLSSTSATDAANITAKTLTASIIGNPTKPYDGNTNATLTSANFNLSGLVGSESFTVTKTTGSYNSADVATANTVTTTLAAGDFTAAVGTLPSNYTLPTSASGPGQINKANADCSSIAGYTGTYDGAAHGATGVCKGVDGGTLAGLNLGATFTNVPGGTAHWVFTDVTGNYHDTAGDVSIVINKANADCSNIAGYTGTYDGAAHGATGVCKGVDGNPLAGLNLGATFTNVPGGTAHWVFTDVTGNYHDTASDASIVINKRTLTAAIIGNPTKTYDGNTNATLTPANFSLSTVVAGESITVTKTTGSYNSKDVTTANSVSTTLAAGDFSAGPGTLFGNYYVPTTASGAGHITMQSLTITADNKSFLFGNPMPTLTASFNAFVPGESVSNLTGTLTLTVKDGSNTTVPYNASTPSGPYTIVPGGVSSTNYDIHFVNGTLTIGAWTINGFYQPVDMPIPIMVLNVVKGGSTVPLKFNIYAGTPGPTTERKNVSDVMFGSVQVAEYNCSATPGYDNPMDVANTGATSLRYDTTGAQFIQNWQTPKPPNKCYQVRMTALDGSHIDAFFKTK